jgi:hypothetical protein
MSNRTEALMVQVVFAFAQGCGAAQIEEDAARSFHSRYHPWIENKKKHGMSPEDVWDQEGKGFLGKFKEIGSQAVQGGIVQMASLEKAFTAVETSSECPYCPDKP